MCGIAAVHNHPKAGRLVSELLFPLQHRGQESAGIATFDNSKVRCIKKMGAVTEVFDKRTLRTLVGGHGIGHVRYSTSGRSKHRNAQPFWIPSRFGPLAIAHNGTLTNADALKREMGEAMLRVGCDFMSATDTEVILRLIASASTSSLEAAVLQALSQIEGAYSLVIMTSRGIIAARDPYGFRPLSVGKLNGTTLLASESCAFGPAGATYVGDIRPGEVTLFNGEGEQRLRPPRQAKLAMCPFELVYFSRPDSQVFGRDVASVRRHIGRILANESPAEADMVVPVPDSGNFAAFGYSEASGIPLKPALMRNHYSGRSFIEPTQQRRELLVRRKLSPIVHYLEQFPRIVLVDDSIVRGTTLRHIIGILRGAGAQEIHVRISYPPVIAPCFFGIDIPHPDDLIAVTRSTEEIREHIGADSLHYISRQGLMQAANAHEEFFCTGCFTKQYPLPPPRPLVSLESTA